MAAYPVKSSLDDNLSGWNLKSLSKTFLFLRLINKYRVTHKAHQNCFDLNFLVVHWHSLWSQQLVVGMYEALQPKAVSTQVATGRALVICGRDWIWCSPEISVSCSCEAFPSVLLKVSYSSVSGWPPGSSVRCCSFEFVTGKQMMEVEYGTIASVLDVHIQVEVLHSMEEDLHEEQWRGELITQFEFIRDVEGVHVVPVRKDLSLHIVVEEFDQGGEFLWATQLAEDDPCRFPIDCQMPWLGQWTQCTGLSVT